MRIPQKLAAIAAAALAVSCVGPVNVAWRGVIHHTENRATTDGRIDNRPSRNAGSVEAPKTSDLKADVGQPAAQAAQAGEGRP